TKYLNHPILVLGYRFEFQGKVLCTAYDHEMYRNVFDVKPDDPGYDEAAVKEGEIAAREENDKVLQFYKGADILVHDTQYTHKEYLAGKTGWGHSSFEWAINSAHKAGVKHLVLFHHEPLRNDQELEGLYKAYVSSIRGRTKMKVSIAQEGKTIEVEAHRGRRPRERGCLRGVPGHEVARLRRHPVRVLAQPFHVAPQRVCHRRPDLPSRNDVFQRVLQVIHRHLRGLFRIVNG